MRWNESEVQTFISSRVPDWEGRLSYKPPKPSSGFALQNQFKERYFKLCGNLLACMRTDRGEVTGVLVLEHGEVKVEDKDIFSFSINFEVGDSIEKHLFVAVHMRDMRQWIEALSNASYELMRAQLISMRLKIQAVTGRDPLEGTSLDVSSLYAAAPPAAAGDLAVTVDTTTPRDRRKCLHLKTGGPAKSNFTSHLGIQVWEESRTADDCDDCHKSGEGSKSEKTAKSVGKSKSTFKSHLNDGNSNNLIEF